MRTPEDPCRDPASEARDDWEQLCRPLTDEERRENARKIEALSVPDRFALMFSHASEPRATPETDALWIHCVRNPGPGSVIRIASRARRLERQRDEAREHAANAEASLKMAINSANARQTEAEHAMRQRDELMEALEDIAFGAVIKRASGGCGQRQLSSAAQMSRHAESAIAAVKGGNG
jgi:hypothetical protein